MLRRCEATERRHPATRVYIDNGIPSGARCSVHDPETTTAGAGLPGLSAEERASLLRIARTTLEADLAGLPLPPIEEALPGLATPRAAFVTLRRRDTDRLRGCRGEVAAARPLVESVRKAAIAAATNDPRFPPVTRDELPDVRIEINALTGLEPLAADAIEIGRHGLMIVCGSRAGLLLPEVPLSWGWNREDYLENLCIKAGLPADAWTRSDAELYGFEAEVWAEE